MFYSFSTCLPFFDLCPPTPSPPFSLSVSLCVPVQDQRVATCSSTTSLRSLGMESWCRCSCLSVMSSPPKCLWIGRQTKVNALVGKNDQTKRLLVIYSDYSFCTNHFLYHSQLPPPTPFLTSQRHSLNSEIKTAEDFSAVVTKKKENTELVCVTLFLLEALTNFYFRSIIYW